MPQQPLMFIDAVPLIYTEFCDLRNNHESREKGDSFDTKEMVVSSSGHLASLTRGDHLDTSASS